MRRKVTLLLLSFFPCMLVACAGSSHEPQLLRYASDGDLNAIEELVARGESIDRVGFAGRTSLIYAAYNSDYETADFLLELGADPNIRTQSQPFPWYVAKGPLHPTTALREAVRRKSTKLAELLIEHGAAIDPYVLEVAAVVYGYSPRTGDLEYMMSLFGKAVDHSPSSRRQALLVMALWGAVIHDDGMVIDELARMGVDLDAVRDTKESDALPETPLALAVRLGNIQSVIKLLSLGADPNIESPIGGTPLQAAVWVLSGESSKRKGGSFTNFNGGVSAEIVCLLLGSGADPHQASRYNRIPAYDMLLNKIRIFEKQKSFDSFSVIAKKYKEVRDLMEEAATGVGAPNSIDEGRPLGSDLNAMNLTITRRPAAP